VTRTLAHRSPAPGAPAAIAAAVAALPALALTPADPADRYSIRRLTVAWLAETESAHTRRGYFRDLAAFLAWCDRQGLDPLTARATDLGQHRVWLQLSGTAGTGRRDGPRSPTTVARALSAVSSWYSYLIANTDGQVSHNPMAGVRRPRVDRDASSTVGLSDDEIDALLDSADAEAQARAHALTINPSATRQARYLAALRDRALVRLLADLGLRVGEGLALDIDTLAYNRGHRTVRYVGKGNKQRERALAAHTLEAVDEYLAARAQAAGVRVEQLAGPLFATTGRDGGTGRLDEPAAFRLIRRLAHHAGVPSAHRLSPHSLRHAFATTARELGVALEDVQDAMGHADARTTRRYDRGRYALDRDPGLRIGTHRAERRSRRAGRGATAEAKDRSDTPER
jgi:site-specific recombinase XerD